MIDPTKVLNLRKSINARIRSEAKRREVLSGEIRKQYVFSLFFKRLFAHDVDHWMLLGGNTLLIHIGERDSLSSSHQKASRIDRDRPDGVGRCDPRAHQFHFIPILRVSPRRSPPLGRRFW